MPYNKRNKKTLPLAKANRNNPTDAEMKLWQMLKQNKMGYKFRRQHRVGNYIVDFICIEKGLIIECDGGQHSQEVDKERTSFLTTKGYKILRFWNIDIFKNIEGVWLEIAKVLK